MYYMKHKTCRTIAWWSVIDYTSTVGVVEYNFEALVELLYFYFMQFYTVNLSASIHACILIYVKYQ